MAKVLTNNQNYTNIANAIRSKNGENTQYKPSQMASAINNIKATVIEKWHQCPGEQATYKGARRFVSDEVQYTNDYSTTKILEYAPLNSNEIINTKPLASATIDGQVFKNEEPNKATAFETTNARGTVMPLDPLRWFDCTFMDANNPNYPYSDVTGTKYSLGHNCRDLGGWKCDGGTIKYGKLIRSGQINPQDKSLMVDTVGVGLEVNLLPQQHQSSLNPNPWNIDNYRNPTTTDFMYTTLDTGTGALYKQWKGYFQSIFTAISQGKGVLFHCGAGADKTGTMAVMIEAILGVSQSDIDKDYELTAYFTGLNWGTEGDYSTLFRSRCHTVYTDYISKIMKVPLYADNFQDTIRDHAISFVCSLGFSLEQINAFRNSVIEGNPEPITANHVNAMVQAIIPDDNGNVLSSCDLANYYWSYSNNGGYQKSVSANGRHCTGFIPIEEGDTVILSGINMATIGANDTQTRLLPWTSEKKITTKAEGNYFANASILASKPTEIYNSSNRIYFTNLTYDSSNRLKSFKNIDSQLKYFTLSYVPIQGELPFIKIIKLVNITSSLTYCSLSNTNIQTEKNASYSTRIIADNNYAVDNESVIVTMGGVNITSSVYNGTTNTINIPNVTGDISITASGYSTLVYYTITNTLSNCSTSNNTSQILSGGSYSAKLTVDTGFILSSSSVTVTMGGTNITSSVYSNGTINIAEVIGNVVITVSPQISYRANSRVSLGSGTPYKIASLSGWCATGSDSYGNINVQQGDIITITGFNFGKCVFATFKSDGTYVAGDNSLDLNKTTSGTFGSASISSNGVFSYEFTSGASSDIAQLIVSGPCTNGDNLSVTRTRI